MEKLNSIHNSIDQTNLLKQIIPDLPHQHHFKIHAAYHNGKVIPSWGFSNRVNEDYHIVLVVAGKGTYTLEGKEESLHRGKIIFVSDKFCHSAQQNQNTGLEIIPLRFGLYSNTNRKPLREFTRPFCISSTPVDFQKYIHQKIHHSLELNNHLDHGNLLVFLFYLFFPFKYFIFFISIPTWASIFIIKFD